VFQVRADNDDPPTRVARLAYAQGSVSFEPAGTSDWVAAGLNRPMTTGDKIWSDSDGRVELQLDGSLLRLSQNTGCSFLNLSDNATQVQLTAGTLLVRVRRLDENETYEIDTPNLAFSVLRPGLYKIAVNENGDATVVIARSGEGEVTGGGAAYTIHAHDSYVFSGTDQLYATREDRGDQDQFDAWADSRDRRWENSRSEHYVSDDVIGYQDFDEYGAWRQIPSYGYVWFPRTTEPDWAPYRYGHWDYIEPWGYTWVEDEPWGFAPFHYGRWMNYEGAWAWVPATPRAESVAYVRPVYAPALVVWAGGVAGAEVTWFALGPREVYVPSYPVSRNYVRRVNVSNTTVNTTVVNNYYNTTVKNTAVTNVTYVNRSVPGALVATNSQVFTTAQPVARNAVRVDPRAAASVRVGPATPTVAPMKQAVLGAAPAKAQPPAKVETRTVVAKATPPPPPPSFEKRQEAIKNNGGKPLSPAQMRQIEPAPAHSQPPVKIAPAAKPAATPPPQPPNRVSQPNTAPPANNQPAGEPSNRPADRPPSASQPKPQPNQPSMPGNVQPKSAERPEERREPPPPPERNDRPTTAPAQPDDKPPAARTAPPQTSSPNLNKKQQQEQEQLRAQQEQERQRLQQQQEQEHAKAAQQQADQAQKQRMEQQHQQQTQQQQQKHAQEQKQLEQKQQQERQGQEKSKKPEHPPAQQP
jgi:DNA segregation ATPase FtsK/SpoIIIE-like protein